MTPARGAERPALTLDAAVAQARAENPAVQVARLDVERAVRSLRAAAAPVANPTLSVRGGPRFGGAGPQADVGVSLQVPLDLGGTPRRRREEAAAELAEARARLRLVELEVAAAARVELAAVVAAEASVALAEDAVGLAEEMERVARRRHELGEVSVLEPNFAALGRADAERALLDARVQRARAERALRELLGLPSDAPLLLAPPPRPAMEIADLSALVEGAVGHPRRTAAEGAARAAEAAVAVARAQGAPGFAASVGWSREGDEADIVAGGLQLPLPIQRNQLGVARATGDAGRAAVAAEAAWRSVGRDVVVAIAAWEAATARFALADGDALPLATQNLALVSRAYEAGKEELLAVLLMQRQALDARRAAIDAELELHRAAAALERAVGQEVFR